MAVEDFTGYTETDPNSDIVVTSGKVAVTTMSQAHDSYVYDDKGASHFGATWEHKFKLVTSAAGFSTYAGTWAISNVINDCKYWYDNSSQAFFCYMTDSPGPTSYLIRDAETGNEDVYTSSQPETRYWTVERTGETTLEARIYSDEARLTLLDTLAVTVTSGRKHRYVFPCVSWNSGSGGDWSFDVEDLDLQEAAASFGAAAVLLFGVG